LTPAEGDVSSSVFISDIHLDACRPELAIAFAGFLDRYRHCEALYILGDLFEAWIGDDDDAGLPHLAARLLRQFSDQGSALYLMHGNRDFLLGEEFCDRSGATLLADPTVIDLYGTPTLLMHGDSLCTSDIRYQQFRHQSRQPDWQAGMLRRSLAQRRQVAAGLRAMSRDSQGDTMGEIVDVTPAEVARVMGKYHVRQLIHGHTHRPGRHREAGGHRWVLGDWREHGWFIEASSGGLRLLNFPIEAASVQATPGPAPRGI